MMRARLYHAVGGYRELFATSQDYDLWTRMAEHSEVANLAEVLTYYRVHAGQITVRHLERQTLAALAICRASALRAKTRRDPLAEATTIDRDLLRRLGVSDSEIEEHLFQAYIGRLTLMHSLGLGDETVEILPRIFGRRKRIETFLRWLGVADSRIETYLFQAYIGRLTLMHSLGWRRDLMAALRQTFADEKKIETLLSRIQPANVTVEMDQNSIRSGSLRQSS